MDGEEQPAVRGTESLSQRDRAVLAAEELRWRADQGEERTGDWVIEIMLRHATSRQELSELMVETRHVLDEQAPDFAEPVQPEPKDEPRGPVFRFLAWLVRRLA